MRGTVLSMIAFAAIGTYAVSTGGAKTASAKATVYMIDRECNMVETSRSDGVSSARGIKDDCKTAADWDTVRKKRNKVVAGTATIHVNYIAPQDGSSRSGKLHFTGRDDEFYELKAGDEVNIRVRNDDLDKISKA